MQDLLVLELQEIHNAEMQLARLIPRLASAATSEALRVAIEERLEEGEQIIADVENGLEELGASPGRKKNVAAEGLGNDLREHVQQIVMGPALDAVLIGGLQKTEHYCIAAWGTVKALAEAAGRDELTLAMERALEEGGALDETLTQIAMEEVWPALMGEDDAGERDAGGDGDDDADEEEDEDEEDEEGDDEDDDDDDGEDDDDDDDDHEDEDEDEDEEEDDDDEDEDDDGADEADADEDEIDDEEAEADDTATAGSARASARRRPRTPLDPQPPVGLPEASIEDDAEDKQEEEETRGRGKHRPGRDN